jgi:ketosteroid isomerase-like protein
VNTHTTESVVARESEFYAAQTASDVAALADILSARLRFTHTTGLVDTRDSYLEGVRAGRHVHGEISRVHGRTRVSGDGAVTTGVIDMAAMPPGVPPFTMRIYHVLVWAREDGRWRLTARQATRQPL